MIFKHKRHDRIGYYPSIVYVNNAMRFLMEDPPKVEAALEELWWAVLRSGGTLHDDVKASYAEALSKRSYHHTGRGGSMKLIIDE